MNETSLYVIKPEAMRFADEIKEIIEAELVIQERMVITLPPPVVEALYTDLSPDLMAATRWALRDPVELGVVGGEDAVKKLFHLAGTELQPAHCSPSSIRFRFGQPKPVFFGRASYFLNAIHRPKDNKEASEHLRIFAAISERKI